MSVGVARFAVCAGLSVFAVASLVAEGAAVRRQVTIKNEDNESIFVNPSLVAPTEKGLVEYVDFMTKGGALTHLFFCACGQRASFDSESWEPIWYGEGEKDFDGGTNYVWKTLARRFRDQGIDPYRVMVRRARDRGVSPWMSMRMNDIHYVRSDRLSRTARFWRDHPEYRIYPDAEPMGSRRPGADFTLDYANKAVRDYNFAMARELLARYDCDGIELDWMRSSPCLTPETAKDESHFLTEFVRRVRKAADRAAADRDHPVGVAVRVPSTHKSREVLGYDVERWVKERLVDIVVLSGSSSVFFELDIAGEAARLKTHNPELIVVPAIDRIQCNDKSFPLHGTMAAYRGWADSMLSRGADGLYLFNLEYSSLDAQKEIYAGGLLAGRAAHGPRRYFVSYDDVEGQLCKPRTPSRLPLSAASAGELSIHAALSRPEHTVEVVMGFDSVLAPGQLSVRLNGFEAIGVEPQIATEQYCGRERWTCLRSVSVLRWKFPLEAFKTKMNRIAFAPTEGLQSRIVWAEIALDDSQTQLGLGRAGKSGK